MASQMVRIDEKKLIVKRAELQAMVASIVVRDADTCLKAKTAQRDIRLEVKMVHAILDPFVVQAKDAYDRAKEEREKYLGPLEALDGTLAQKVKDYERLERERTEREAAEFNRQKREREAREADERRREAEKQAEIDRKAREKEIAEARKAGDLKAAEARKLQKLADEEAERKRQQAKADAEAEKANFQEVTVRPNIPSVSGVPSRRNYKFRILDANKIPRTYLCPDEQKIGRDVRDWKKIGEVIPGVECYED